MDGLIVKPTNGTARSPRAKPRPGSLRPIDATEIDPTKAVGPAPDGGPQESPPGGRDSGTQSPGGRECVIDPEGREVMYRAVDIRAESHGQASSVDVARKLRAYRPAHEDHDQPDGAGVIKTA